VGEALARELEMRRALAGGVPTYCSLLETLAQVTLLSGRIAHFSISDVLLVCFTK
jgi:hypothetical protein